MPACECCGTAVTLTPEEAHAVAIVLRQCEVPGDSYDAGVRRLVLAARLGASS